MNIDSVFKPPVHDLNCPTLSDPLYQQDEGGIGTQTFGTQGKDSTNRSPLDLSLHRGRSGSILTPPATPSSSHSRPPSTSPLRQSSLQSTYISNGPTFSEASYFTVSNSTFVSNSAVGLGGNNALMLELTRCSFTGAEFDSSERDPPPRCHPDTRSSIISKLHSWAQHLGRGQRQSLGWLHGPAGVGKSAIMQTFAEDLSSMRWLGATIFFSKQNKRSDPSRIIPTVAFQLAVHNHAYGSHISSLDPSILRKSMKQQFSELIAVPFSTTRLSGDNQNQLILLDGLDECDTVQAQAELLMLIISFIQTSPKSPLLWVISSRPEYHLKNIFERPIVRSACMFQEVPVDGTEACNDVEKYLHQAFDNIRSAFPDIVPSHWPSSRQFLAIAKAASGLFAFAVTVMRFVGDGFVYGDPVSQLATVIAALEFHDRAGLCENPLGSLDALYTHILSAIPENLMPVLHLILGFYTLKGNASSLPLLLVANILGLQQNVVYHAVQRLHSVLEIPRPGEAHQKSLRFFHKSFADYLVDADRAGMRFLDRDKQSIRIALCYIRKLEIVLEAGNSHVTIPISWARPEEPNLGKRILCEVKQSWLQILPKIVMQHAYSNYGPELQTLIDSLERLEFNAFDVSDALGFINFVNWIANSPFPFWRRLIHEEVAWANFNVDRVDKTRTSVYYRTRPDRWGYWSTTSTSHILANLPSLNPPLKKYFERHALSTEDFSETLQEVGKTSWLMNVRVLIVGSNPSKRCAVVLTSVGMQEMQPVVRYYFPLKA